MGWSSGVSQRDVVRLRSFSLRLWTPTNLKNGEIENLTFERGSKFRCETIFGIYF
jgi:hypothetical protein